MITIRSWLLLLGIYHGLGLILLLFAISFLFLFLTFLTFTFLVALLWAGVSSIFYVDILISLDDPIE